MTLLKRKNPYNTSGGIDSDEIFADSQSVLGGGVEVEHKLERPLKKLGSFFFLALLSAGLSYLVYQGAHLSLEEGGAFFKKSQENRFLERPIFPPRGLIYDNSGELLVENIAHFGLIFESRPFNEAGGDLAKLLKDLGIILDKPREFFFDLGFPSDFDPTSLPSRVVLIQGLDAEKVVPLTVEIQNLPGVQIFESYRRVYSNPLANAHILGFVGKVSPADLRIRPELLAQESVGKSGIEAQYDNILRGSSGRKILEVNAAGEETRFKLLEDSKEGSRLDLSIHGEWQKYIYQTLEKFTQRKKGASVVALDPQSGALRALVSYPAFDINDFSYAVSPDSFEKLLNDPLKPFFNRAISGEFPSGSVIKPLIAAAALEENIIDPAKKIYGKGYIEIPNPYKPGESSRFLDWREHGWINFYDAIAYSANVYFYMIGGGYGDQRGLGIRRINDYAHDFGLGEISGIDLPGEKSGLMPDPETKKISEPNDPVWRIGDTYNVSIGQGGVKVTPLQMAVMTAAIANGGNLYKPHVLKSTTDAGGESSEKKQPELIREDLASRETLDHVVKGMRQTVTSGTAGLLAGLPVDAAAKTGTAQAGSGLPHAWVTAFAPVENPEIVLVVMVEHAGEGSTVAVPITYEILKWYFDNRQ